MPRSSISDIFRITLGINKLSIEEISNPLKAYPLTQRVKMVGKHFVCDEERTVMIAKLSDIENLKIAFSLGNAENIGLDVFYNRGLEKFYPLWEKVKASLILEGCSYRPDYILYKKNSPMLLVFEEDDSVYAIAPNVEDKPEPDFDNKWWKCKKCGGVFLNPTKPKHDRKCIKHGIRTTEPCNGEVEIIQSPEIE